MTAPTKEDRILATTKWAKKLIVRFEIFIILSIVAVFIAGRFWHIYISTGAIGYLLMALIIVYLAFAIIESYTLRKLRESGTDEPEIL